MATHEQCISTTPSSVDKTWLQLGNVFFILIMTCLMGICPLIISAWFIIRVLACFFPAIDMQQVGDSMYSFFLRLTIFFYLRCTGVKIYLYGDKDDIRRRHENVLYISNHQSSADWIVACFVALYAGCLRRIKFVMKQELHWVPMIGFYLHQIGHVFVRRRGFRKDRMLKTVDYVSKNSIPIWVGIFPEGTRFHPEQAELIAKSKEVAKLNDLQQLEHQLTPRPKGSWLLLDNMRSHLQAVYNVTIVYEHTSGVPFGRTRAPGVMDIAKGACSAIHIHMKRIPVEDVPTDEDAFARWLHDCALERDSLLASSYSSQSFSSWGPVEPSGVQLRDVLPAVILFALLSLPILLTSTGWTIYLWAAVLCTLAGYTSFRFNQAF